MTVQEILLAIRPLKPVSKASIHKYLNDLGIRPLGRRQRPQRYPEDSAKRILKDLGLANGRDTLPKMPELKAVRTNARRAR